MCLAGPGPRCVGVDTSKVPVKQRVIYAYVQASLMFLVTSCGSLSTVVKHSGLTGCPVELQC